jgi:hypothetical protein
MHVQIEKATLAVAFLRPLPTGPRQYLDFSRQKLTTYPNDVT